MNIYLAIYFHAFGDLKCFLTLLPNYFAIFHMLSPILSAVSVDLILEALLLTFPIAVLAINTKNLKSFFSASVGSF